MTAPSPIDSALVERKASGPSVVVMVALEVLGQVCCTEPVVVAVEVSLPTSLRYSSVSSIICISFVLMSD
jgi:hypothetical protein